MGDILKEAIVDARALKETALQNAKFALEETFTPRLKSMLTAKLREDEDDFEDEELEEEEPAGDEDLEEPVADDEEFEEQEDLEEPVADDEELELDDEEFEEQEDLESDEDEIEVDDEEDDLDLESIIKELEDEIDDEDTEFEGDEELEVDESLFEDDEDTEFEDDEELEVDESLFEDDEEFEGEDDMDYEDEEEVEELKSELKQYKEAIHILKDKLHEVNLLNAKLLYTNKLFREFALGNNQKLKVIEMFDRAKNARETKLIFATLAESFRDKSSAISKHRKSINELASRKIGSTKPKSKIITEEDRVSNRFKELAGIL